MHQIVDYLTNHARHHMQVRLHVLLAVLLTSAFVYNYTTGFKRQVMNAHTGQWIEPPLYILFYAVPYFGTLLLQRWLTGRPLPRSRTFWWLAIAAVVILAFNRSTVSATAAVVDHFHLAATSRWFIYKCLLNVMRTLEFLLPLLVLSRLWDRRSSSGIYGLAWRSFDWRPYLLMLLAMAPPILWASYQPAFLKAYPIFDPWPLREQLGWPVPATWAAHEVCYALRFIGVELFFRGFLVIGLGRWLGRDALLPMVVLYALWHFGKPMPEALGSIFGGYLLGVIAWESRCVLGGTLVHMGIALMMNAAALWREWPE